MLRGMKLFVLWKLDRFKKRLKKVYNFSDKETEEKWQEAVRDPQVPKGTDQWLGYLFLSEVNACLNFMTCQKNVESHTRPIYSSELL